MRASLEPSASERIEAAKKWAAIGYALQAASFLVGISYIAAVILAYLKRSEARGTWVETHYLWQIRTFWYSLLWGMLAGIAWMWMVGVVILVATLIWMTYRIVAGWVRLSENQPAYAPFQGAVI